VTKLGRGAALIAAFAFIMPLAGLAQTPPQPVPASGVAGPPIPLELNKLEPVSQPAGCRVYLLTNNPDGEPFEQFRLDLILFETDGVIARRVALDLGPLPAKKQAVRLFDLQGLPCDEIGKVLINDVIACGRSGNGSGTEAERGMCLDRLAPTSRAKAPLTK
jgi:hypothetical protein